MTPDEFRQLALSFPGTIEASHMAHPDFRVGGKIFATLGPGEKWGMLKLAPPQQAGWIRKHPKIFEPIKGSWGKRGATRVELSAATSSKIRGAMEQAWRNTAPKRLLQEVDSPDQPL